MNADRRDGPFEVPLERLAGGRGQGRRAALVAVSIVAVLGGAIGLARLADGQRGQDLAAVASASAARTADGSPTPPPPSPPARTPGVARVERLLDVPDDPLPGAPELLLVFQHDVDARLVRWTPGAGTRPIRTFHAAFPESAFAQPVPSPDGHLLVTLDFANVAGALSGGARLLDPAGHVLWKGTDIAPSSGALWSDDGRLLVTAGTGRTWHLVSIDRTGRATDRVVDLPGEIYLPSPIPIGSITIPPLQPRSAPLGFSADGAWAYGALVSAELGIFVGTFRVAVDGTKVERVLDLGVGRPDGLVPREGTLGASVDPATGRVANWRVNPDITGGPPSLDVRAPDAGFAFTIERPAPFGVGWAADGDLIALMGDRAPEPDTVSLVRIDRAGRSGAPILRSGPVAGGLLVGVRDPWAAFALYTSRPALAQQLVVVDLADPGRISATPVSFGRPDGILLSAGLLPPAMR